ncbi:MAG TPA: cupin domain-containing protein [Steroidobacteraceae bacterium]|jgi:hypothetical protein
MPDADHVIPYHLLTAGTCYAKLADGEPVELRPGEVILFPAGDRHVLAAASREALGLKPVEISGESLGQLLTRGDVEAFECGEHGSATHIICGFLAAMRAWPSQSCVACRACCGSA